MAVPEVDRKLLRELEAMGFPVPRATRALHFCANSSLEDAVNWIIDHENDPDIDEMPLLPVEINLDTSTSFPITEELRIKAEELRSRDKEEKGKELERERVKERRQEGKELLQSRQKAKENERSRASALKKADLEKERRAMEQIRQKLDAEKTERKSKLRAAPKDPAYVNSTLSLPEVPVKLTSVSSISTKRDELLRNCLRSIRRKYMEDDITGKKVFQTLQIYIRNVMNNPDEEKFRKIRLSNPIFQ